MKKTVKKYDLEKHIKYKHSIEYARWNEDEGKWKLRVQHGQKVFDDECDVFINAGGVLK